ncbi:hypothetical protein ACJ73_01918 [Blastomyces percursus]|uniref:Uncharacterized protein n=1 Tax=Blastomyces percursus TaxID=1658174 RepID=A0A1J9RDM6_9EURO|nr:hypothetical protein ACJ73_01918 [Blastomyces percursus]
MPTRQHRPSIHHTRTKGDLLEGLACLLLPLAYRTVCVANAFETTYQFGPFPNDPIASNHVQFRARVDGSIPFSLPPNKNLPEMVIFEAKRARALPPPTLNLTAGKYTPSNHHQLSMHGLIMPDAIRGKISRILLEHHGLTMLNVILRGFYEMNDMTRHRTYRQEHNIFHQRVNAPKSHPPRSVLAGQILITLITRQYNPDKCIASHSRSSNLKLAGYTGKTSIQDETTLKQK